jgi:hypothetical protein
MSQLHDDLKKHLLMRLRRVISDHLDTCVRFDVPDEETYGGSGDVLLFLTCEYYATLEITPQQFIKMCFAGYRASMEKQKRDQEREQG